MKKYLIILTLTLITLSAYSQEKRVPKIYVELKPLQFLSGGYSVVGHYALNDRWQLGANVFSSELSNAFNQLGFDYDDAIIDLMASQDFAINFSFRYFLNKQHPHKGWQLSLPVGYETWTLKDQNTDTEVSYEFWNISPRIGYLWYPLKRERFYILSEAVFAIPIISEGAVQLGNSSIQSNAIVPIPSIGLGIRL
ncbi:MAG: hypothetical protein AAF599_06895 [Bacteroidota bacterium]